MLYAKIEQQENRKETLKNQNAPEMSEVNFFARLSHCKQLLKKSTKSC